MPTRHDEGPLTRRASRTADAPTLYFSSTVPEGTVKAAVGLIHGYAEYGARYAHVIDAWAERGIATVTVDLRGHGRAQGQRGFCERFSDYLDDAAELVPLLADRAAAAPAILFGHSLGGLIAASLASAAPWPWRGLVLSAPYFGLAKDLQRTLADMASRLGPELGPASGLVTQIASRLGPELDLAGGLLGSIASRLAPNLAQPSGLHGADLTHDAARARAYDEDPLVFKTVSVRWFVETREAQARTIAHARALTMPLYVVTGTEDRVAKVESARAFFDAAGSADKTWDAREGLFHEVLNEPEWRTIADRIADWILSHA
jgi:alpha-beta hydrolase superfamily lysophospholipase